MSNHVGDVQRMMRLAVGVILLLALGAPCRLAGQGLTDEQLVAQFFPQDLVNEVVARGDTPAQQSAFVRADLSGSGTADYLVVVYTTGHSGPGKVVALRKTDGSAEVASEANICSFAGGGDPGIEPINLDQSGQPQFVVSVSGGARGAEIVTVLRWNGTALEVYGAYEEEASGCRGTVLSNARFVDLDGDGILEIVNPPPYDRNREEANLPASYQVFKLVSGRYTMSDIGLDSLRLFFSDAGSQDASFSVANITGPHFLIVMNGEGDSAGRVTSAEIRVNGAVVAGSDVINASTNILRIPLTLTQRDNTLTVTATGEQGRYLSVAIGSEGVPRVSIDPPAVTMRRSEQREFRATVTGNANKAVNWQVALGPNAPPGVEAGSISAAGVYTAPANVASEYTVIITASSQADTTKSSSVVVTLVPQAEVTISPPGPVTLTGGQSQQFTATVSYIHPVGVKWSLVSEVGTISSTGLYTAPATILDKSDAHIKASSLEGDGWAIARVILEPTVSISLSPAAAALAAGGSRQFTATVTGINDTRVVWSLALGAGAPEWAETGTLSHQGLYTAPSAIGSPYAVVVTVRSLLSPAASASATVTLSVSSQPAAAPTFSPGGGYYSTPQTVTLSTSTSGASIRYTTDGSTPSDTAGTLYSGPITVSATTTLKAVAFASGLTNSSVSTAIYTIQP